MVWHRKRYFAFQILCICLINTKRHNWISIEDQWLLAWGWFWKNYSQSTASRVASKSISFPAIKTNAILKHHKNRTICPFLAWSLIFFLRNWKYNKDIYEHNKDVSWHPYCISWQNKEKHVLSGTCRPLILCKMLLLLLIFSRKQCYASRE